MRKAVILVMLWTLTGAAEADFTGRVVSVGGGDVLTVLADQKRVHVRLQAIHAPEIGSPFGKRAQHSLAEMCASKNAWVIDTGTHADGKVLAWVKCDRVNANVEQVRRGMAWVFPEHVAPNSPLYSVEAAARTQRVGLWSNNDGTMGSRSCDIRTRC